jgi:hypothetical protein
MACDAIGAPPPAGNRHDAGKCAGCRTGTVALEPLVVLAALDARLTGVDATVRGELVWAQPATTRPNVAPRHPRTMHRRCLPGAFIAE